MPILAPILGVLLLGFVFLTGGIFPASQLASVATYSTSGATLFYSFDETSGSAIDESGNGNTGTLTGATRVAGKSGNAASFTGAINQYVSAPDAPSVSITGSMTLEAWVYPSAFAQEQAIIRKGPPGNNYYLRLQNGYLKWNWGGGSDYYYSSSAVPLNTWSHVAFVYNSTTQTASFFINGVQSGSATETLSPTYSLETSSPFYIGGYPVDPATFSGMIDEVRIYKRALTQGEVQSDMNAVGGGLPPTPPPVTPPPPTPVPPPPPAPDTTSPSTPTGFTAVAVSSSQVNLNWNASTDNVGVTGYRVYRGGTLLTTITGTTYSSTGLTAATNYTYTVQAYDAAGNNSSQTGSVSATTQGGGGTSSYSTNFPLTENPMSEGGRWLGGFTDGVVFKDVRTTPGRAFASGINNGYDDSLAILNSPSISNDHYVEVTVYLEPGYVAPSSHEIELLLRGNINRSAGPNYAPLYEVLIPFGGTNGTIIYQNGSLGGWQELSGITGPGYAPLKTGDIIRAQIIGSTISVFVNGVLAMTVTDSRLPTGKPGIGFFVRPGGIPEHWSISSARFGPATATPSPTPVPPPVTPPPPASDTTPPTITITSPVSGVSFLAGQPITISASASDTSGIQSVQFLLDGVSLTTDTTSPYSTTWTSTQGAHTILARATDSAGNTAQHSVTVTGTAPTPPPPPVPPPAGGTLPSALGWYAIPNTHMRDVCPTDNVGPYYMRFSCKNVVDAWSGGIFDEARNRLIIWGGGHGDYYGNELYSLNLNSLTFSRLNNQSPPNGFGSANCPEALSDGNPNSRHTYSGLAYIKHADRMYAFGGSLGCGGGSSGSGTWTLNLATLQWQRMDPTAGSGIPNGIDLRAIADYDPNTRLVFIHDGTALWSYNYDQNRYTRLNSDLSRDLNGGGVIDPKRKLFFLFARKYGAGPSLWAFDISPGSTYVPQDWSATISGCGALTGANGIEYPGLSYDSVQDRIVGWVNNGSGGNNSAYVFNPDTRTCTTQTYSGGPEPDSTPARGTHGRWRYSPVSNVFAVVNDVDQNAYVLRLTNGSPPPPTPVPPPVTPPPPASDTTPPTVTITAPVNGVSFLTGQSITISASASDTSGIQSVQFLLDGVSLTTDTTSPYSTTWTSTQGAHTILARATDTAGNTAQASISVTGTLPPASTKFIITDRIQTTATLNIRATANTTGTLLGTQPTNTLGTITSGPTSQGGFNWWQVNFDSGVDGYAAEDYMVKYVAPNPTPTPPPPAPPPAGTADWVSRSTAPGVIWAHDFTNDNELNYFIRSENPLGSGIVSNPTPNILPNGLTLGPTPFGNSRAIVSRAVGTTLTAPVPAASNYPVHDIQVWSVADASSLPNPNGHPYQVLVGDGASSGGIEWVELQSVNTSNNTITVRRKMSGENGGYGTNTAPAYPAGFTVGRGPQGSWNRPFAAFPAGQNGKSTADVGIVNGSVTKPRTWDTTQNGSAHVNFREGYFGHRSYWDPAVGPATYRNWQPRDSGQHVRNDAWDGDEFYLQFRAKISASRFNAPTSKMLFIQNPATSGSGQFFWTVGGAKYGEKRPTNEVVPGTTYGQYLVGLTSYADSAARAGGILMDPQTDSIDQAASIQKSSSYPLCGYYNRPNNMYCWTFPAEKWVTYLVHFKFGKDNAALNPNDTNSSPVPPWPAINDASYRTKVEILVADEGDTTYKTITNKDDFVWMFGDGKDSQGYYYYNPPGLNAFWMSQNLNDYVGGGSVSPPRIPHQIEYTQTIFSKSFIPVPNDSGVSPPPPPPTPVPPPVTPPPPASDTTPPTVTITAPVNGVSFLTGQSITISASASDTSGIQSVQFLLDGVSLTTDTTSPYSTTWTSTQGAHTILARATDSAGNTAQASISVTGTLPPASTKFIITDRIQTTATLNIRATANTTGTLLGTQPTNTLGTITSGPTSQGGFNWWQVNFDSGADGYAVEDYMVKYVAPNPTPTPPAPVPPPVTPPPPASDTTTPSIPSTLSAVAPSALTVDLSWNASTDNIGVTAYRIFRCTGTSCTPTVQVGTSTGITFQNSALTASTTYRYRVRAVDAAGNTSPYSVAVSVTTLGVSTPTPPPPASDTTPPTVTITAPVNGVSFLTGQPITISASASDTSGIQGVQFLLDGASLTTDTTSPYSTTWTSTQGSHTILARATDSAGNTAQHSVAVTGTAPTPPPPVTPTPPTAPPPATPPPAPPSSGGGGGGSSPTPSPTSPSPTPSSGGGGGGSTPSPTPATPTPSPSGGGGGGGGGTGIPVVPPTPSTPRPTRPVTLPLKEGSIGEEVKALQAILIYEQLLPPTHTTGIFDQATRLAVEAFQRKENIVTTGTPATTGYGGVGPATRTKLNLRVQTPTTPPKAPTGKGITITRVLYKGLKSPEVTLLQTYLIQKGLLSSDSATGFFGTLTEGAVKKLQATWNLEPVGSVGPKTRQYLKEGR